MDTNPFQTARSYLNFAPVSRWGAMINSILAAVCLALLFPLLYLFIDLLTWHGRVPSYASLTPTRQQAFRDEFNGPLGTTPGVVAALEKIQPPSVPPGFPEAALWEWRWEAVAYATLDARVGHDAAEAYFPLATANPPGPTPHCLGVLSLVVRERGRWTGAVLGWLAGWNTWAWAGADNGSANNSYLTGLFALAFVLALVRGVFLNAAAHGAAVATIDAATRLRRTVHMHGYRLAAVAVRPEARDEAGELVTRRVEQIRDGLQAYLTAGVRGPVLTVLLMAILLASHFWLTVCLLALAAAVWLVAGQAAVWFRRDARRAENRTAARLGMMRESLSQVQLVKAYLMDRFSQTRLERHLTDLSKSEWRRQRGEAFSRPTLYAIAGLVGVTMLYLAGRVVLAGEMSVAGLVGKAAAIGALVYGVNRWIAARVRIARAREAAADVVEFLGRRGEAGQGIDAEFLPPMTRKLEFVGVSLREAGTGRMILEDVNLTLPALARGAVVFGDADEARALALLVTRFLEPTAGEIRVDGKNTRWVTTESVRTQVALVLEQSLTFTDTVANNIGCGDAGFSLPRIVEAAKLAHVHQFVQRLPYGYETVIGDGGVSLRPGQRFQIALARALLRDPSLIIIEEPVEPLDPDSIVLIDDTIARVRAKRTLLFLARRVATIKAADRVFVLQKGKIVAAGSHDELLAGSDLYRTLSFKQTLTAAGSS